MLAISRRLNSMLERLKTDTFYRHAIMFTTASLIASAINYIYYPIMGRLMGVASYGELQVVTSFILQLTTVYLSLNLINVGIVANHDEHTGTTLMTALQKAIFWLVLVMCLGVVLASSFLQHFFHFSSIWPFLLIVPVLLIDTASIFWTGYLQGHRQFLTLSAYTIMVAVGKVAFAVGLVLLGFGVPGGVAGIALGLALGLVVVRFTATRPLPALKQTFLWPTASERKLIRGHLLYIIEVIVGLVSMGVLLSIDVILVKHLFSSGFAGQYAGVATIARIIFFASSPLVMVMLPAIKRNDPAGSRAAFRRTLTLSLLIGAGALIVFSLFPHLILVGFLGSAFAPFAHWLPLLGILVVLVTLTNIMVNYLLALRSHWAIVVSLGSLLVTIPLILWHHATVPQIVLSASIGLLVGQLAFWLRPLIVKLRLS